MSASTLNRENHLLSIVSALGGFEEKVLDQEYVREYAAGDEVLACLRDLKKLLRQDDQTKDKYIMRKLGHWRTVKKDFVPLLLADHKNETKITSMIIELLVPLTWPLEKDATDFSGQLEYLREYKEAFLHPGVLSKINAFVINLLSILPRERTDRDLSKIRLVLMLFRNLLGIKDLSSKIANSTEKEWKTTLQERLVVSLEQEKIIPLFLSLAGSATDRPYQDWNMITLEIFYNFFIDRDVDDILSDKMQLAAKKSKLMDEPKKAFKKMTTRHPRFGGTIMLALQSGKTFNVHSPLTAITSLDDSLNRDKAAYRPGGFRTVKESTEYTKKRVVQDPQAKRILRETASFFVEDCFNSIILSTKRDFDIESSKVQDKDFVRFFWICKFSLEFFRKQLMASQDADTESSLDFTCVAGIMNERGFALVFKRINVYLEEKKYTELQNTLDCLKEMLLVLELMINSDDVEIQEVADAIQSKLFYEVSNIELVVSLCKDNKTHMVAYMVSLVESIHQLMKLLENYSKSKDILFTRKKKKEKKPKEKDGAVSDEEDDEPESHKAKYVERQFRFSTIESNFAYESVLGLYCSLLQNYRELEDDTVWHTAVMFHRIFVKCEFEALFYKLSVFELFRRIVNDAGSLPKTKGFTELLSFIKYALRKFFKSVNGDPLVVFELLYNKSRGDCRRIQYGDENFRVVPDKNKEDVPVEPEIPWTDKVAKVIKTLRRTGQTAMVRWIKEMLDKAVASRKDKETEDLTIFEMEATEDYQIEALSEDVNIEELLTIFSFKRTVDDVWTIPTSLSANDLQGYVSVMNECLKTTIAGKKRKDGGETKRKRRVKGKETEFDVKKIVSEQFIEDSDEDGADDAAFFAAEAERRKKWSLINSGNYEKEVPAPKSSAKEVVEGNAEDLLVSKDAATVPPQEDNPSDGIESSSESSNGGSSEEEEEDAMSTDGDADVEKKKPRLIISSPASDKAATDA